MKVYISGHILRGGPNAEQLFREHAEKVRSFGHEPVVPHDIAAYHPNKFKDCPLSYSEGNGHSAACWLRGDFIVLLECDAILMIGKWESSVGAQREHSLACWSGIPIFYGLSDVPDLRNLSSRVDSTLPFDSFR